MSKSKSRSAKGRSLFYTRDSGGKHEMTPGQYVAWACRKSKDSGLSFDGSPAVIEAMIRDGESHRGDIFLDYDVCGNELQRPGLGKLMSVALADLTVSHFFIPRRDRLSRPDDPIDAIQWETLPRRAGITIVYMDKTLPPIRVGQRQDLGELVVSLIDFNQAGEDRRKLARNVLFAQLQLAQSGCATGGRPCYAFRRWLIRDDGFLVRELLEGERVRMAGHHVFYLPVPYDHPEMVVVRRILVLLEEMPASRVAALLTAEGVPAPDAGRLRTDRGVRHQTSGVWHASTINNIARNPLLLAICSFGRRSMGDQLRFTPDGPRELEESDYRPTDHKPKVIRNAGATQVTAPAKFDPLVDVERHLRLLEKLDERGATQRGKPRSQDPGKNPLGGRTFDMACGWPMYRGPYNGSFRYICGLYQQSHGQKCSHNHVDGPAASRFLVGYIQQRGTLSPRVRERIHQRLEQLVRDGEVSRGNSGDLDARRRRLSELEAEIAIAQRNMALASTPEIFHAVSSVFQELTQRKTALESEIEMATFLNPSHGGIDRELEAALSALDRLPALVADPENLAEVGKAFDSLNLRLFASFRAEEGKKRTVNRLVGGVVTFGNAPPPVPLYEGPTARKRVKNEAAAALAVNSGGDVPLPNHCCSGREGKSLGNVDRDDRTAIELFLAGVQGWEVGIRRQFESQHKH